MILLDTDHLSQLKFIRSDRASILVDKLKSLPASENVAISIISVEEQMRGWLATIAKERDVRRQVKPYKELAALFNFFDEYLILEFNEAAVDVFEENKARKLRIGTMDLKIASITIANKALLLSANLSDFKQVPGLRVENWLE